MYGHTYSKIILNQPGKMANPARGQLNRENCGAFKFAGLFTVHFFCSVQMVMVSKNHVFKWFAVMVFTLSRLKMEGFGETRFAAVGFTVPG